MTLWDLTALALSYAVDWGGIDLLVEREADEAGDMLELPAWHVRASPWVAAVLAAAAVARALGERWQPAAPQRAECCAEGAACGSDGHGLAKKAKRS